MKRCRTKSGEIRLRHEGKDYVLTTAGLDLSDELAESIRPHVNVLVDDAAGPEEAAPKSKARP